MGPFFIVDFLVKARRHADIRMIQSKVAE